MIFSFRSLSNLVPKAFSSFKIAVGETPGQGCWNTPRIVDILSRDTWWNGFFGCCFQRLAALFVFLQSETVVQAKRRHFIVFTWQNSHEFLEPFWQPWPGVSPTAILNEEKALGTRLVTFFIILPSITRTCFYFPWRFELSGVNGILFLWSIRKKKLVKGGGVIPQLDHWICLCHNWSVKWKRWNFYKIWPQSRFCCF